MCTFYSKTQNRHPKQKSTAKPNIKKDVNKKTPTILPKGNAQGNTLLKTKPIFFSTSNAFKNYNKVKKEIIWFGKVFLEQKMLIPLLRKGISNWVCFSWLLTIVVLPPLSPFPLMIVWTEDEHSDLILLLLAAYVLFETLIHICICRCKIKDKLWDVINR